MSNWFQADPDSLLMQRIETSGRLGRHAAAWLMLVWSVWIFLTPLSAPRTFPHWMVPTLASYAVFLLLFYCAYYRARRYVPWCVVGFALLGYLVNTKHIRTLKGDRMFFGTFTDARGNWIDTVHFPESAYKYPLSGNGFYRFTGTVMEEFGTYSINVSFMEKVGIRSRR